MDGEFVLVEVCELFGFSVVLYIFEEMCIIGKLLIIFEVRLDDVVDWIGVFILCVDGICGVVEFIDKKMFLC